MRADISLLFNFFVTGQRIRRVLGDAMAPSGMKPDEYAVYNLLFEKAPLTATQMSDFLGMPLSTALDYLKAMSAAGHLDRLQHPDDGRALQLRLSTRGMAAFRRAHADFEVVHRQFVRSLGLPVDQVMVALAAMDDAAQNLSLPRPPPGGFQSHLATVARASSSRRSTRLREPTNTLRPPRR